MGQDVVEALSVLPHGELQPLLEDVIVAWGVGQAGERVDLLLEGSVLMEAPTARSRVVGQPGRLKPVKVAMPFPVSIPPSLVPTSVPVTSERKELMR